MLRKLKTTREVGLLCVRNKIQGDMEEMHMLAETNVAPTSFLRRTGKLCLVKET